MSDYDGDDSSSLNPGGEETDRNNGNNASTTNEHNISNGNFDNSNANTKITNIRMLEFFSGIGGMRLALQKALPLLNGNDNDTGANANARQRTTTTATSGNNRNKPKTIFRLEFCRAYDISLHANNVYRHNFEYSGSSSSSSISDSINNPTTTTNTRTTKTKPKPQTTKATGADIDFSCATKLVEQLKPKEIEKLNTNLWTMSPPCQPFTTNGKNKGKGKNNSNNNNKSEEQEISTNSNNNNSNTMQHQHQHRQQHHSKSKEQRSKSITKEETKHQDDATDDKRCNGLKGIISLLNALGAMSNDDNNSDNSSKLPRWILLENVKGFADSEMCRLWFDCLASNGYVCKPYLLSPVDFGIPNHRKRFYVLAEHRRTRISNGNGDDDNDNDAGLTPGNLSSSKQRRQWATRRGRLEVGVGTTNKEAKATNDAEANTETVKDVCDIMDLPNYNRYYHSTSTSTTTQSTTPITIHKIGKYVDDDDSSGQHQHQQAVLSSSLPSPLPSSLSRQQHHFVPQKVLSKPWSKGLGIVTTLDTATHCFTAGYGRIYHRSTGSLLLVDDTKTKTKRPPLSEVPLDRSDMTAYENKLRRFTPEELLKLFGFVDIMEVDVDMDVNDKDSGTVNGSVNESNKTSNENSKNEDTASNENNNDDGGSSSSCIATTTKKRVFEIPSDVVPSLEQRYKLIGNSISVNVVTELLYELLLSAA